MTHLAFTRVIFLIIALAAAASAKTIDHVTQHLDVTPGGGLTIDVDFGTIDVAGGTDNRVDVEAERSVELGNETREREYLSAVPITVTKQGNVVTISAHRGEGRNNWDCSGNCSMNARYTVRVPKNFGADLHTRGGGIDVSNLVGVVKADTNGGSLMFNQLQGQLSGKTSGGAVLVQQCEGPLNLVTSGGHIDARGGSGRMDAKTSGGSIAVRDFSGDTHLQTSGGQLTLSNISGRISGRTSGGSVRATLAPSVPGDVDLETAVGSIEVAVPENVGLNLDAHTSIGRVETDLPFSGQETKRNTLRGTVNGGGKSLMLRTGAGSIYIHGPGSRRDHSI